MWVKDMKTKMGPGLRKLTIYREMALKRGADHAVVVDTSKVYTAPWVRLKCRFGCGRYNTSLCCPPRSPTPEEMRAVLDSYTMALLLHRRGTQGSVPSLKDMAVDIEKAIFLDGYYKAWAMGHGPCDMCKECNVSGTCLNPEAARPSMEACGIDVFKTAQEQGMPIKVLTSRTEEREFYALILIE
jgi:predicted metal-binding protein